MSLLFNMLSRLVIAFLPRSKRLLISWLQSSFAVILGAQENKVCHFSLMAQSEEELKSLLIKVKEKSEKAVLKLNIQKTVISLWSHHFMANRWGKSGKSNGFNFLGLQITADSNCSHEIERRLLLGRKVMTNLDSIFKSRDITLPTKVRLVKAMVFPVVMYGCESWTVKKVEC